MPWRGPVAGSAKLEDLFPSLGWGIADWLDDLFPWQPLIEEQVRKLVFAHRLDPKSGVYHYSRAQFMGPKGCGKSPEAAKLAVAHLEGPVRFAGWDADGEPVGASWQAMGITPLVEIAAVSIEQTDNTYGALLELLTENDSKAADTLGLDPGVTRTVRRANPRALINKVTASSGAREGARTMFAVLDETHLWTPESGGKRLADVLRRNVTKMDGFSVETTNAYAPSRRSVAQATDEAVQQGNKSIYQWKPQVGHVLSLTDKAEVRPALRKLYLGCHWVPVNRLVLSVADPEQTEADRRRFYLNEIWDDADAPWTSKLLKPLVTSEIPDDGCTIAIGFDGARYHDSTALVGVRLEDRHSFPIGVWEKPAETDDDDWEVPAADVSEALESAFDRWRVKLVYCDPPYWEDDVDRWAGRFGPVKKWYTANKKPMAYAVRAFDQGLQAGFTYKGLPDLSDPLSRHLLNCRRRDTNIRDDDGRFMFTVGKEFPRSVLKIDCAVAGIVAQQAAGDAIALGGLKSSSGVNVFI